MNTYQESSPMLPFKGSLTLFYWISILIALLMTAAGLIGLLAPETVYPDGTARESLLPNDVVNLAVGVPMLLLSMWLTHRGKLIGLLFWPGALFYPIYNYLAYLFALPHSILFVPLLALAVLSVYALIGLVARRPTAP